ncbi:hypothetical protein [Streptomyces sp. Midd1]|uniref:hypothetical protein n=1 Tax=Streptomyces sp. Midd3 TaxID=3161191 RepID=UPI0034DB01A8
MLQITTEWYRQITIEGKTRQRKLSSETEELQWPSDVADHVAAFLRDNPKVVFSGMEEFGSGHCVTDPTSPRCKTHGDCRAHHIESARAWVEQRADELKDGETETLTCGHVRGTSKWVSLEVERLPEPDEVEEPEEEPAEEPEQPAEEQPAEKPAPTPAEGSAEPPWTCPREEPGRPLGAGPYTWHQVWDAMDKAEGLIGDLAPSERDGDLLTLFGKAVLKLLDQPGVTLDQVMDEEYADQGGAAAVRTWWTAWS